MSANSGHLQYSVDEFPHKAQTVAVGWFINCKARQRRGRGLGNGRSLYDCSPFNTLSDTSTKEKQELCLSMMCVEQSEERERERGRRGG